MAAIGSLCLDQILVLRPGDGGGGMQRTGDGRRGVGASALLLLLDVVAGPAPPWWWGWGSLVHAGGAKVVLRAVPGFFWWRRCGGGKEWATGLAKNLRQAWCCRAKAFTDVFVGGDGGGVFVAPFSLLGAPL